MSDNTSLVSAKGKGRPRSFDRDTALMTALRIFWKLGYEPASVSILCKAMEINPPSFYAAFKSKEKLFLEAIYFYEKRYWTPLLTSFENSNAPLKPLLRDFFNKAAAILLNPENPSGCMVVLAAVNIAPKEERIAAVVKELRRQTRNVFARRLHKALDKGELYTDVKIAPLADAFNIMLEGMSIQAKDAMPLKTLQKTAVLIPNLIDPYLKDPY